MANRTDELRALGLKRVVHIADGQRTQQYVPAEDFDAVARERDDLRTAARAHEWQPIATAPRDRTVVELWHRAGFLVLDA